MQDYNKSRGYNYPTQRKSNGNRHYHNHLTLVKKHNNVRIVKPSRDSKRRCPMCGVRGNYSFTGSSSVNTKLGSRTPKDQRYPIMRCRSCGGKFCVKPDGRFKVLVNQR